MSLEQHWQKIQSLASEIGGNLGRSVLIKRGKIGDWEDIVIGVNGKLSHNCRDGMLGDSQQIVSLESLIESCYRIQNHPTVAVLEGDDQSLQIMREKNLPFEVLDDDKQLTYALQIIELLEKISSGLE